MNSTKCSSVQSHPKKNNVVIPVVASVAGGILVLLIILAVVWNLKIRRKRNVTKVRGNHSFHVHIATYINIIYITYHTDIPDIYTTNE